MGRERCDGDSPKLQSQRTPSSINTYKDIGQFPADEILARSIGKAKESMEDATGMRLNKAFVANPKFPGLCNENIDAALNMLSMDVIRNSRIRKQPNELSASYAAYGRGLCSNYTRRNPCEYEERWELPLRTVMVVAYTDEALLVEYSWLFHAVSRTSQDESLVDWQAGANSLRKAPDSQLHWDRIRVDLLEKAVHWPGQGNKVDIIVLAGPHARNETFLDVVKDTFAKFQSDQPELLMDYADTTGARGAAELAFKAQYQH